MEAARIDWNNIDSVFVEDRLYEHFKAPQWVDLLSPDSPVHDDVAWFCTPDCSHPVTADDFLTSSSHHQVQVPPLRRNGTGGSSNGFLEDVESKTVADSLRAEEIPYLKSTLSASNLFAGRDVLKQVIEFCTELKKLATKTKEKEFAVTRNKAKSSDIDIISSPETDVEGNERSPLFEVTEQASDVLKRSKMVKEKKRINRRVKDAENVPPITIELDKNGNLSSRIRTSPPTPQCFSATRGPPATSPASKTRLKERQILGEVKQTMTIRDATKEENLNKVEGTEVVHGKTHDVFWFLKPCALSSSS